MTSTINIEAKDLNVQLNPIAVLQCIGYEKSSPKRSGDEIRDFCPIHGGDNERSLAIDATKNIFCCHNCGAKGDLIELYRAAKGIDFKTALDELVRHFRINCDQPNYKHDRPRANTGTSPYTPKLAPSPDLRKELEKIWNSAKEKGTHTYYERKKINPCEGVRYGVDQQKNNALIVPYHDVEGNLNAIQYINEDDGKFFHKGTSARDSFFTFGAIKKGGKIYIAEGLATAATIYEAVAKEWPVVSVGPANNIYNVYAQLKEKYPSSSLILALDNDEAGRKILEKVPGALYVLPKFEGMNVTDGSKAKDFNDLISACNQPLDVVKEQLVPMIVSEEINPATEAPAYTRPSTSLKPQTKNTGRCIPAGEALKEIGLITRIKKRIHEYRSDPNKINITGIPTGFARLDEIIDGLQGGHLVIIAGRTGTGKSWIQLNKLKNISIDGNIPTVLFNLEMSNRQIFYRLISMLTRIQSKDIKRGNVNDEQLASIEEAILKIANSELLLTDDPANINLNVLLANLQSVCEAGIAKAAFIDHIGLMDCGSGYKESRTNEIGKITKSLKITAKEYDIPIVCLAQLNREADISTPPKLSQLSESGHLEQDADIVMLVHRRDYHDGNDKSGLVDIIVKKNRDGGEDTVAFEYDKNTWLLKELKPIQEAIKQASINGYTNEVEKICIT